jgi:hypothetical protein
MKNIRYAIAGTAVAAGSLAFAGCSSPATTTKTAPAATASAASETVKTNPPAVQTHITVYSVNSDAPVFSTVVSGPTFGDHGAADEVPSGSTVPTKHAGELLMKLSNGTFRLNIADIGAKFTKGLDNATIASTCSDYVSVSGDVPVVPGSGTGVYRGLAGTLAGTLTVNELHPRPCLPNSLLFRQLIWINLAGTVTTTPKA